MILSFFTSSWLGVLDVRSKIRSPNTENETGVDHH